MRPRVSARRALCLSLGSVLALAACERSSPTAPPEALQPATTSAPGIQQENLAPLSANSATTGELPTTGSRLLPVASARALQDDGGIGLEAERVCDVHPAATFELRIGARIEEARLVLTNARGVMLPASGSTELLGDTTFRLVPTDPLRPGEYVLRLEGLAGRTVRDDVGRGYEPITFRLHVPGEPDRESARSKAHRRSAP